MNLPDGIHDLTDAEWGALFAWDGRAGTGAIVIGAISNEHRAAYLDAAAALWAGLVECERDVLRGRSGWGPSATFAAAGALRHRGLHRWIDTPDGGRRSEATPLGRAVARAEGVLREDGGA